jgi:acyl carrier protein
LSYGKKLPLTATGKINRRALPIPGTLTSRAEAYTPPRDTIEETLVNLWSEVLGIEKHLIGVTDNFFELGGHSLKATILASKIHKELHVKIPLAEILNTPFIREIAAKIQDTGQTRFMEIETVEEKEYYQLSYNQKRLWIIYCMDPDSSSYHMPGWIQLNRAVNIETLKKALSRVFNRHESFRTGFKEVCNQPVQFIRQGVQLPFTVIDLSDLADEEKQQKTAELIEQTIKRPFDLHNPPLFRSVLIKQDDEAFVLVYCMHHIISDGWSNHILQKEFNLCYESYLSGQEPQLAPLQFHYRDFSAWHNRRIHDLQLKEKSHRCWSGKLGPGFPTLNLPNYYSRDMAEKSGAGFRCTVNQDIKNRLHLLAREHNTTLFTVLFSMFNLLLSYLSGQQEVALCIISAGREHISLNNIVGYFTTPIIVKNRVDLDEDFDDLLSRINREVLEAFLHQAYPLELAADEMRIAYPDIPAAFNLINMQDISLGIEMDSLSSRHMQVQRDVKFDIVLYITEYKNGIEMQWHYKMSLFKPESIESIAGKYLKLMAEITGNE